MHQSRAHLAQAVLFTRFQMDGVTIEAVCPQQAERLVGVQIVTRLRIEAADPCDQGVPPRVRPVHPVVRAWRWVKSAG